MSCKYIDKFTDFDLSHLKIVKMGFQTNQEFIKKKKVQEFSTRNE